MNFSRIESLIQASQVHLLGEQAKISSSWRLI